MSIPSSGPLRVLVTAVAGDLGQAIVKALRLGGARWEIHGCDVQPTSYASAFVASYHVVPCAADAGYLKALEKLSRQLGVCAIIPASEPEMFALMDREALNDAPIVSQRGNWLSTFSDKLLAMRVLEDHVALAPFADGKDAADVLRLVRATGYPVVVKPRRCRGSRDVRVVHSRAELDATLTAIPESIVQTHLDGSRGEFSIGVFRCPRFETAIAFRRTLIPFGGITWEAEQTDAPEITAYALQVARAAGSQGSVNVQIRLTQEGPRLLEINPRFSSLVSARAACGFCDVEWSLSLAFGENLQPPRTPFKHARFHRFFHEVMDFGEGYGMLPEWSAPPPGHAVAGRVQSQQPLGVPVISESIREDAHGI